MEKLNLSRDHVENLDFTLKNIMSYLQRAFNDLRVIRGKKVIMCIGSTGCGKSTLLNALRFGPDSMEDQKREVVQHFPNNVSRKYIVKLIDIK